MRARFFQLYDALEKVGEAGTLALPFPADRLGQVSS
jgi:hypothetical protein